MLKILKYSTLLLFVPFMASCDLEEVNYSGTTADVVWSSPEGFETLVNGAYYNLREQFYGRTDIVFFSETGTDIWINGWNRDWFHQVSKYDGLDGSRGQVRNFWDRIYSPINMCNAGIERIDDAGIRDPELRDTREGELRFLRAYYYWHIVETFGGVHLRTEETKSPVLEAHRSPVSDFYDLMFSDLELAEELLPVNQTETGRATKASAKGLLARLYLTYGSYLEYHQNQSGEADEYYQLARDKAAEVIDNQGELGIRLYDSFSQMFDPDNNKDNDEAMFRVTQSNNDALRAGAYNRLHTYFIPKYEGEPGMVRDFEHGYGDQDRVMPTRYLLELFNEEIDARYYATFREVWYRNDEDYDTWQEEHVAKYQKPDDWVGKTFDVDMGDTAIYVTKKEIENKTQKRYAVLDINDVYDADGGVTDGEQNRMWPAFKKYRDPDRFTPDTRGGYKDVIVMRLAEMYLIAAEAELALNNPGTAADYINVLRERAAVKTPVDRTREMMIDAGDVDLKFIMDERARELCGEHLRWFDLKRTKMLEDVLGEGKANPDVVHFDPGTHYLRPIPLEGFLDALLNREEFGQNPGYE